MTEINEKTVLKMVKLGIDMIRPVFQEAGREIELVSVKDGIVEVRIKPYSLALELILDKHLKQVPNIKHINFM